MKNIENEIKRKILLLFYNQLKNNKEKLKNNEKS